MSSGGVCHYCQKRDCVCSDPITDQSTLTVEMLKQSRDLLLDKEIALPSILFSESLRDYFSWMLQDL